MVAAIIPPVQPTAPPLAKPVKPVTVAVKSPPPAVILKAPLVFLQGMIPAKPGVPAPSTKSRSVRTAPAAAAKPPAVLPMPAKANAAPPRKQGSGTVPPVKGGQATGVALLRDTMKAIDSVLSGALFSTKPGAKRTTPPRRRS